ncbi:MAG: hypothetical protein ACLFTR_03450 [Candidatus Woesearchaeota archaeon]
MEIAAVLGLGIMAYLMWQVIINLDVRRDEKQEFLQLILIFYFAFIFLLIPEYLYLQNIEHGLFERLFLIGLWFQRAVVSVLFILILKQVGEWAIATIQRWFGK